MIEISKLELSKIKEIGNVTTERIMFVLLVMAKYYKRETYKITKRDILKYSKCHLDNKSLDGELYKLNQLGYITTNHRGTRTVNILSSDDIALEIEILSEMINVYLKTCEEKGFIFCLKCAKKTEKTGTNQKYCERCRAEEVKKQTKKRVRKSREKLNVTVL